MSLFMRVLDWLQVVDFALRIWRYSKTAWLFPVVTAITAFLYWIDWGLVCIVVLFIVGVIAGICEWRCRLIMVRDANDRADRYKMDMDITWLQSRSFELDENKRKRVVARFMLPQLESEAKAVADVLKNNGWAVDDPTPFYPQKPEVSLEHTVKVELPWGSRISEGSRYAATLTRLTRHKVYVVDDDVSDIEPKLEQGVSMRVSVYGHRANV